MPWYKNVSHSPWRRPSGQVVPPGERFQATPREVSRIRRRKRYGRRLVLIPDPPAEEKPQDSTGLQLIVEGAAVEEQHNTGVLNGAEEAPGIATAEAEGRLPEWPLRMAPSLYLRLHPSGPNALLARRHMKKGEEDKE